MLSLTALPLGEAQGLFIPLNAPNRGTTPQNAREHPKSRHKTFCSNYTTHAHKTPPRGAQEATEGISERGTHQHKQKRRKTTMTEKSKIAELEKAISEKRAELAAVQQEKKAAADSPERLVLDENK